MTLQPLSQLDDWELVDADQDLRGRGLRDEDGNVVGTIVDMIVDTENECVEAIVLDDRTAYSAREFDLRGGEVVLLGSGGKANEPQIEDRSADRAPADRPPPERQTIVVPVRGERLYAEKVPMVVGELVISKRPIRHTHRVSGTVRRLEVSVETKVTDRSGDHDDSRLHPVSANAPDLSERPGTAARCADRSVREGMLT